jgi:hypothetical protein
LSTLAEIVNSEGEPSAPNVLDGRLRIAGAIFVWKRS